VVRFSNHIHKVVTWLRLLKVHHCALLLSVVVWCLDVPWGAGGLAAKAGELRVLTRGHCNPATLLSIEFTDVLTRALKSLVFTWLSASEGSLLRAQIRSALEPRRVHIDGITLR